MAFAAGQKLTAAALNAAVGATWTVYSPTWSAATTAPVIGNGSIYGGYVKIGKTITCRIAIKPGTTTTYGSGTWTFSLPEAAANVAGTGVDPLWTGVVYAFDAGTANRIGVATTRSGGTNCTITNEGSSDTWRSTIPQTWANGDYLGFELVYEAATF